MGGAGRFMVAGTAGKVCNCMKGKLPPALEAWLAQGLLHSQGREGILFDRGCGRPLLVAEHFGHAELLHYALCMASLQMGKGLAHL